jgi:hypothetical protein
MRLAKLERVPLGEGWGGDGVDFGRWLGQADNLSLLGTALGRSLAVADDFPPDLAKQASLCCRDTESGIPVLVRVDLDNTTDEQLGELLTAASGLNEALLVWAAGNLSERHEGVLNWLNKITSDKINFFGVEVVFWRIGDSAFAPTLTVVARPNGGVRNANAAPRRLPPAAAGNATLSAALAPAPGMRPVSLFLEYWLAFDNALLQRKSNVIGQKPTAANWMSFPLGGPHFNLVATVNVRDHFIAVALVLTGPEAKSHFQLLQHSKVAIENEIGAALEWQELPEKAESRVLLRRFGVDPEMRVQWQEQHDWLADKLERFQRAFSLRVEALSAEEERGLTMPEAETLSISDAAVSP